MKKLVIKILLFLLPVLLVWLALEVFYRTVDTNFTEKNKQIRTEYADAEVLVLGNSHTLFGVNPDYFQRKTYNIANVSQTLYFDELIFNTYVNELPELKAVILNVSYFSLTEDVNPFGDAWRKYFYKHQMKLDVDIVSPWDIRNYSLATARRFKKSATLVHEYVSNGTVVSVYPNGYGVQDKRDIVPDKAAIATIIAKKHEDGLIDFKTNIKRLIAIVEACKQRNIQVVLVEMPVYEKYDALLNEQKKNKIERTLKDLENTYTNTSYIKLSRDPRFTDSDLRDADHLTNEGAKKASILLNNAIEELLGNN